MDYILVIIGIISPIILSILGKLFIQSYIPSYINEKAKNLATKEDIGRITKEIEEVKNIYKIYYDLSKTEREFYEGMIKTIYKFLAKIKKYEFENRLKPVTNEIVLGNMELKQDFFEFIDSANEFVGKSYVFLKEENLNNLKDALNATGSFVDLTNNLLYAMRKSIHPDTKLKPKENLKEFKYL